MAGREYDYSPSSTAPQQTPKPNASGQGNFWTSMDPETRAALVSGAFGIGGGLLSGYGQSKQNDENREANAEQAALNRQLELYLAQMNMGQRQAEQGVQTAQAAPTRQDWRQRQAMMADIMPGLRNVSVQAPGDLGRFVPQISGGLRIPEGGFSPEALAFFSPEARVNAEADLDRAGARASGGQAPTPNYSQVGYGMAGQGPGQDVTNYSQQIRQSQPQPGAMPPGLAGAANRMTQTQTQLQRQPQQQGPGMGARLGNAALQAGLAYAGNRWGGSAPQGRGGQQQSPWLQMALQAAGGYFGR
jgi:hypothetical protein